MKNLKDYTAAARSNQRVTTLAIARDAALCDFWAIAKAAPTGTGYEEAENFSNTLSAQLKLVNAAQKKIDKINNPVK